MHTFCVVVGNFVAIEKGDSYPAQKAQNGWVVLI